MTSTSRVGSDAAETQEPSCPKTFTGTARDALAAGVPDSAETDAVATLRGELAYAGLVIKMSRDSLDQDHPTAARRRLDWYLRGHPQH